MPNRSAAIIDVDGTLVDSVYHHALCWHRAFAGVGLNVPVWRCHRRIGMGGDQLVTELAGERVEDEHGSRLRAAEAELFSALIDEVQQLEGAVELIEALSGRGPVTLASSAEEDEVRRHIDELGVAEMIHGYTTASDVDRSKPHPDVVGAALELVEGDRATMVGDSVWDVEAARRAGVQCVGVLSGGFSEQELREAGAIGVYDSPGRLAERLDETPFGGSPRR